MRARAGHSESSSTGTTCCLSAVSRWTASRRSPCAAHACRTNSTSSLLIADLRQPRSPTSGSSASAATSSSLLRLPPLRWVSMGASAPSSVMRCSRAGLHSFLVSHSCDESDE